MFVKSLFIDKSSLPDLPGLLGKAVELCESDMRVQVSELGGVLLLRQKGKVGNECSISSNVGDGWKSCTRNN